MIGGHTATTEPTEGAQKPVAAPDPKKPTANVGGAADNLEDPDEPYAANGVGTALKKCS